MGSFIWFVPELTMAIGICSTLSITYPFSQAGNIPLFSYPSDGPVVEYQYYIGDRIENLFAGDKVDFQVQAMIGNIHRVYNPNHTSQLDMYPYVFTGEVSDWSNTQTITMPDGSVSSSTPDPTTPTTTPTTPTPSDYIPQTTLLLVGIATVVVIRITIDIYSKASKTISINSLAFGK